MRITFAVGRIVGGTSKIVVTARERTARLSASPKRGEKAVAPSPSTVH